jgi:hypothetical protein
MGDPRHRYPGGPLLAVVTGACASVRVPIGSGSWTNTLTPTVVAWQAVGLPRTAIVTAVGEVRACDPITS